MNYQLLARCLMINLNVAERWAPHISNAMGEFDIDTSLRQAAFLAQVGHESGGLHYTSEIWNRPTLAQLRYEGRTDLGNVFPGDGYKYRGRGLLQITGRANYVACGRWLGLDLVAHPELLEQPDNAARSAGWFWKLHGLNELADASRFEKITRVINGGINGLAERTVIYQQCLRELSA